MRLLVAFLVAACTGPTTPRASAPMLSSADLSADLDVLENAYRTLHPGLARYNTPAELAALFADAHREVSRDRTVGDAFVILTKLTAAVRCGHSYPNPSNQTKETSTQLFVTPRLPFLFRWIGDEMVITRSFTDLAPGSVVEEIDGLKPATILAALLPLARADGHNDAKRRAYLSVVGESTHEAFDILAPLVFPQLARNPVELTIGGRTVKVPLQSYAAREAAVAAAGMDPAPADPLWRARMIDGVAYLAMPTWVAYKSTWDWKADLEGLVQHLVDDRVPALVIDLRGNEGGNDIGDELIAHLIDRPFARDALHRRVRFGTVPDALRPVLDTWDPSFYTLGEGATVLADGWRELPPETGGEDIAPRAPRYRGKVIVLIDGSNSSATFQFARAMQRDKLATLIGEPTGGNQRGINGGAFFFVRLPHTHLEVDLPLIGTFPDGNVPDAGVDPDITVPTTAADIAAKRDPQLARALELARN